VRILAYVADLKFQDTLSLGVSGAAFALLQGLAADPRCDLTVLVGKDQSSPVESADVVNLPFATENLATRYIKGPRCARELGRELGMDVVLFPKGVGSLGASRTSNGPLIVPWIHDDIPFAYARGYLRSTSHRARARSALYSLLLRRSALSADVILTTSAFSARRLESELDLELGQVVPIGSTSELLSVAEPRLGRRDKTITIIPSTLPHKAIESGVLAAEAIATKLGAGWTLCTLGGPLRPVSGASMVDALASTSLLVFPSLYEGYGLPPLEAFALGTPAIVQRSAASCSVMAILPCLVDMADVDSVTSLASTLVKASSADRRSWAGVARAASAPKVVAARLMDALSALKFKTVSS